MIARLGRMVGWGRLWDVALDLGERHVRGLQNLSRLMGHHGRGEKPCPLCEKLTDGKSVLQHVMKDHEETRA